MRLTKAQKREARAVRQKFARSAWREREKEARKQQTARLESERKAAVEGMTEAERAAFERAETEERDRRYDATCAQNARLDEAQKSGLRVAFDLYYGSQMIDKEQRSLARQLGRCCGANRRSQAPVCLHLASLGRCPPNCLPPTQDHLRWKVHLVEEDLEQRCDAPTGLTRINTYVHTQGLRVNPRDNPSALAGDAK